MFNVYNVELLDTKDHVYLEYAQLAPYITRAIEIAKSDAINVIEKNKIDIKYIRVSDENNEYLYNMLTRKTFKMV